MGTKNSKRNSNKKLNKNNNDINKKLKKGIKSFNVSEDNLAQKSITIYYKNKVKIINYSGKFNLEFTKKLLKSYFFIQESIDQFFFEDEDKDILILNSNIPDNIIAYLLVREDFIPKNPSKALKISYKKNLEFDSKKSLLKFNWSLDNEIDNLKYLNCIEDKYIYKCIKYKDYNASVRSSASFTTGTYFFVIRIGILRCYESLAVVEDEAPDVNYLASYKHKTFIGYYNMEELIKERGKFNYLDIAIYIDMDRKKCIFYNYDKKKFLKFGKIRSDSVKLFAWLKNGGYDKEKGMIILNEGCIPIPDWVKL